MQRDEPYRASAESLVESTICIIPATTVRELVSTVPGMALALLAKLAHELRISEDLMMDLHRRPARQRVALLLLSLAADRGPETGTIPTREYRRKDLARMAGITPETFSRVLHGFSRAGMVTLRSDRIGIRDARLLRRAAGESDGAGLDARRDTA